MCAEFARQRLSIIGKRRKKTWLMTKKKRRFRVQGAGFGVQGTGCRIQGSGCTVEGSRTFWMRGAYSRASISCSSANRQIERRQVQSPAFEIEYRGISLIRNCPPPQDHRRALGIVLLWGPKGAPSDSSFASCM